ncbi:MAG: liaR 1 [Nocardioides sp.]|jgi:NarL family two-component system response regulator LiaR|uniref:helix-turn-helix transcriptional regulator n=1 Tax=Nocardioides sp. TaxID=35761 RepID=UPI002621BF5D|nr:response regulator transcription factor [Nocardioides sp.]MCW2833714.1 liaR 1 [Nocardioides sp.]
MTEARGPLLLAVVNDFPVVTAGVAALLAPYAHRVKVEEFVGEVPPRGHFDVLLLDNYGRPDPDARLAQLVAQTDAAVLVFAWAESQEQIDAAVALGAAGFLSKTVDAETILAAVEAAAAGHPVQSAPARHNNAMAAWPGQDQGLTARESEVLSLIVSGMSNLEIADRIFLSINSVKSYIRTAYRKMGVASRSQAVLWGLEHGFQVKKSPSWLEERR